MSDVRTFKIKNGKIEVPMIDNIPPLDSETEAKIQRKIDKFFGRK